MSKRSLEKKSVRVQFCLRLCSDHNPSTNPETAYFREERKSMTAERTLSVSVMKPSTTSEVRDEEKSTDESRTLMEAVESEARKTAAILM